MEPTTAGARGSELWLPSRCHSGPKQRVATVAAGYPVPLVVSASPWSILPSCRFVDRLRGPSASKGQRILGQEKPLQVAPGLRPAPSAPTMDFPVFGCPCCSPTKRCVLRTARNSAPSPRRGCASRLRSGPCRGAHSCVRVCKDTTRLRSPSRTAWRPNTARTPLVGH